MRWAILAVIAAFAAFLVVKSIASRGNAEARKRLHDARRRAKAAKDAAAGATAWREAAMIALDELHRPALAAALARRADRLDPESVETLEILATAMVRGNRFLALEALLWRRLAERAPGSEGHARTLERLLVLYEGPMRRPWQARALRALSGPSG